MTTTINRQAAVPDRDPSPRRGAVTVTQYSRRTIFAIWAAVVVIVFPPLFSFS